ncbi:MAG: cupredoxin domain-containing protein [Armatimonadetes bacterium]|nr:cupredoxin domain-containing protein [Armatimonadota bacterium]
MDTAEVAVLVFSTLTVVGVVWYFFLSDKPRAVASADASGVQHIKIRVRGGYEPSTVEVVAGRPVKMDFYRDETDSCSETVVIGEFGIAAKLRPYKETSVEFTPNKPGKYPFHCGMNMLHGSIVVKEADDE